MAANPGSSSSPPLSPSATVSPSAPVSNTSASASSSAPTSNTSTSTSASDTSVSSTPPSSSSTIPPSSTTSPPPSSTTSPPPSSVPPSTSFHVSTGTDSAGNAVTVTETRVNTQSQGAPTATASGAVRGSTNGFLQNKAAMGAVFAIVGLVAAGIIFALVTNALRRRRARRFDREIAEEAKRAPAPVFVDDDDYPDYHSDPYAAAPTAYADHAEHYAGPAGEHYAGGAGEHYAGGAGEHYGGGADHYSGGTGDHYSGPTAYSDPAAHTDGGYPSDALSSGVHSNPGGGGGTPSNYMYPSGYSDLGFSDVSSHGTYAQPPMEGQYNPGSYGAYGAGAAGAGAGAYEMTGYHSARAQPQAGVVGDWGQQGYPPAPGAATTNSSGSDVLLRSKSGARSLVDAYAPGAAPPAHAEVGQPKQYADGYVSQYQTHADEDPYGGLEGHGHGHGDDGESDDEGDGRRVLKVANE